MANNIVDIADPLAEESDYEVTGTLVGPDGTTPVQPAAVTSILATLRDLELDTLIFEDENVTSSLSTDGEFIMPLDASALEATVPQRFQKRLLTLKILETNGKKRKHAIRFTLENLQDVS